MEDTLKRSYEAESLEEVVGELSLNSRFAASTKIMAWPFLLGGSAGILSQFMHPSASYDSLFVGAVLGPATVIGMYKVSARFFPMINEYFQLQSRGIFIKLAGSELLGELICKYIQSWQQ